MKVKTEERNNTNVKNKRLALFLSVLSLFVLVGIGFAYFSSTISNTNNEKLSTETATISLKFDDNDNGISGNLNLGESITKKFTLENTGTKDAYAKINWYNLVNSYTSESLTYTLEQSTSENGLYTNIDSGKVPTSNVEITKVLKNGILVPVNTKYYYKLTIILNNLDVEQNSDISATFSSYFNLEEGFLSGVDKIRNLIVGSDSTSTSIITKPRPNGASCTNTLVYDGTTDNSIRYVGENPCNYVTFNEETAGWRIVGIMNNVDDGTGNKETRIKLIRKDKLGDYSWDSSDISVNNGNGINEWTQADLMYELNGDYLDTTLSENTKWYNGEKNARTGVYDYTKGLNTTAQNLIDNAEWYLGGTYDSYTTGQFYTNERRLSAWNLINGTCDDGYCPRTASWIGKVALISASDVGFANGKYDRNSCLSEQLNKNDNYCYPYNWLFYPIEYKWLLNPANTNKVRVVSALDCTRERIAYEPIPVRPSVYLKSDVRIIEGDGSEDNPYTLG